ncbi:MAG TPA: hypothetical protein VF430_05640 [Verrucomicrobiae bacterium]
MKKLLRIAAASSFGLCFAGGFWIFCLAAAHWDEPAAAPIAALGLIVMGMAVLAGSMIWWAAEKLCFRHDGKGERNPSPPT